MQIAFRNVLRTGESNFAIAFRNPPRGGHSIGKMVRLRCLYGFEATEHFGEHTAILITLQTISSIRKFVQRLDVSSLTDNELYVPWLLKAPRSQTIIIRAQV